MKMITRRRIGKGEGEQGGSGAESNGNRERGSLREAIGGWLLFAAALYAAGAAASLMEAAGIERAVRLPVQALIVAAAVVPGVCALYRRRFGRLPIGISGRALKKEAAAAIGAGGTALLLAAAGFAHAHALGWLRVEGLNATPALLAGLGINLLTALLYEALPEELVFRALIPDALRGRMRAAWAFLLSPLPFVLAPVTVRGLQAATGLGAEPITADYLVLLTVFAVALQSARSAFGRIGAGIGFHLAYLMLARFVVLAAPGEGLVAYTDIEPETGSVAVLFLTVVAGGAAAFAAVSAIRRKKSAVPET
ncbi:hypothetical protein CDO73_05090 [Saccharibacillus sp. O23]|uniref:CPBP family intramembrane glutamic endopeptidase n=1 Tax=Saccharibacillus sp. O23 TaxID=2009338 RepID=UPI000B4E4DBE|nr:CPBP family intramembrane glutamic endopeptidase [Saccharibacillus sp. O23]OWR31857.1 hypothetical protein CDO73_05090 [Saccharibacillus sp. O23]